ncbi:unnamed protein product [Clavelina lepadiformis]|uniref:Uncharacterized protein n=1 Tax=Clavelina lepadiformis TaxID=159417 RepID=A0ABP0FBA4_CLALP
MSSVHKVTCWVQIVEVDNAISTANSKRDQTRKKKATSDERREKIGRKKITKQNPTGVVLSHEIFRLLHDT